MVARATRIIPPRGGRHRRAHLTGDRRHRPAVQGVAAAPAVQGVVAATVYLTDIARKAEMDAEWCEWIGGPENWPQRACVQAALVPGTLVEITVIAARR